jgi:hypothetical protein
VLDSYVFSQLLEFHPPVIRQVIRLADETIFRCFVGG